MEATVRRTRLFLDTGVIVAGCIQHWGAAKVVLTLCTYRKQYMAVIAEDVERELHHAIARKSYALTADAAHVLEVDVSGWLERVQIERWPQPTIEAVRQLAPIVLPALRHVNDLRPVITAIQAQPDWVISGNRAHWNDDVAARTGLRIVTPQEFVGRLLPPPS